MTHNSPAVTLLIESARAGVQTEAGWIAACIATGQEVKVGRRDKVGTVEAKTFVAWIVADALAAGLHVAYTVPASVIYHARTGRILSLPGDLPMVTVQDETKDKEHKQTRPVRGLDVQSLVRRLPADVVDEITRRAEDKSGAVKMLRQAVSAQSKAQKVTQDPGTPAEDSPAETVEITPATLLADALDKITTAVTLGAWGELELGVVGKIMTMIDGELNTLAA